MAIGGNKKPGCIAVIGGGTMGADIAASFVARGWLSHIVNPPDKMGETLVARLGSAMSKLGAGYNDEGFGLHQTLESVPWQDINLVIESVPEQLDIKRVVFARLVCLARPDTPLCSNSSAIPISKIGEGLETQHRMLGAHYFMPAHLVPAVEVVCSPQTDKRVADVVSEYLVGVGKVPCRVNLDIPGFLANRLQHALSREALSLVERGIATPEDVDKVVRYGFGLRYIAAGPLLQRDHAGLDVHCAAAATIYPDLSNTPDPSPYMVDLVKAGHYGIKTKRGFYDWTDEKIAVEKERYETSLMAVMRILDAESQHKQK